MEDVKKSWPWSQGVSLKQRAIWYRSLATMFESGVPLLQALQNMAEQGENETLRSISFKLSRALSSGHRLSKAMSEYLNIFTKTECRLVHAGEESGRLGQILMNLAKGCERQLELQQKVKGSLFTPLLVSGFCLLLVIFIPPLLFKGLFELLNDTDTAMPWPTQVLMTFSNVVTHPLFYSLAIAVGLASLWLGRRLWRQAAWRRRCYRVFNVVPLLGTTLNLMAVVVFSQTLVQLIDAGIPLLTSVEMAGQAPSNPLLTAGLRDSLQALQQGETISYALRQADFFPESYLQSLRAGEDSHIVPLLTSLIDLYRIELEHRMQLLTQILEPVMMLIVGCIVGFTCLATLLPTLKVMERL